MEKTPSAPVVARTLLASLATRGSGLVRRLVRARNDPVKERIRMWILDLADAQLRSGLGLTSEDITVLRAARCENVTE
jgi:hypothetical protein